MGGLTSAELSEQIAATLDALGELPGAAPPADPADPEAGYGTHGVELASGAVEVVRGLSLRVHPGGLLVLHGTHGRHLRSWPSGRWACAGECDEAGEAVALVRTILPGDRRLPGA